MASLQLPNCKKKSAAHKNGFEVLVSNISSGPSSSLSCVELNWILLLSVSGDCCRERDGFFWLAKRQWVGEWVWSTPSLAQVLFIFWSKLIGKFAAVFRVFTILSDLVPKFVDSAATTRGEAAAGAGTKLVSTLHSGITSLEKFKTDTPMYVPSYY